MNRTKGTHQIAAAALWLVAAVIAYMLGLAILFVVSEPDALFWQTAGIYTVLGVLCGLLIGTQNIDARTDCRRRLRVSHHLLGR